MTDKVTTIESWMQPYWSSFIESKHPVFGIWICKYINNDNIIDVYEWFCKQYNHDHFVLYVPCIVFNNEDVEDIVHSFIKKLNNINTL